MLEKVYIIILNYNSGIDTIECLESVFKLDYPSFQVILVDNNSDDNSVAKVKKWAGGKAFLNIPTNFKNIIYPLEPKPIKISIYDELNTKLSNDKLIVLKANENRGFSAGNNIGIRYVQQRDDFKYCWIINNDTVVDKNSLTELVKDYNISKHVGILGSKLLCYDDPESIQAVGGKFHKKLYATSHIGDGEPATKRKNEFEKIDYVVGASMLVSKEFLNKIGLLSEDFFLYYEEMDWAFRAKDKNLNVDWSENSIVYHKEGKTTGSSGDYKKRSVFSEINIFKSRKTFFKKYPTNKISFWISSYLIIMNRLRRKQINLAKEFIKILHKT